MRGKKVGKNQMSSYAKVAASSTTTNKRAKSGDPLIGQLFFVYRAVLRFEQAEGAWSSGQ